MLGDGVRKKCRPGMEEVALLMHLRSTGRHARPRQRCVTGVKSLSSVTLSEFVKFLLAPARSPIFSIAGARTLSTSTFFPSL